MRLNHKEIPNQITLATCKPGEVIYHYMTGYCIVGSEEKLTNLVDGGERTLPCNTYVLLYTNANTNLE